MNTETKIGLGVVVSLCVCCAGPLVLPFLLSGTIVSALSAVSADDGTLLLGIGTVLATIGILLGARAKHAGVAKTDQWDS
jgi:hypothetical protein